MAPTFVSYTEAKTLVVGTTGVSTANIAVQAGDLVVAFGAVEDSGFWGTLSISFPGGLTGTVTQHQSDTSSNYAPLVISSAQVVSSGNITAKFAGTVNVSANANVGAWVWRNHGGIGQTNKVHSASNQVVSSGSPYKVTLAGASVGSAVVCALADWSAQAGARTYLSVNGAPTEDGHFGDGASYRYDAFRYSDVGTAGSKDFGQTAPTPVTGNLVAVEILAPAGPAGTLTYNRGTEVWPNVASAPSAVAGQTYFDSTTGLFMQYNGTVWRTVG